LDDDDDAGLIEDRCAQVPPRWTGGGPERDDGKDKRVKREGLLDEIVTGSRWQFGTKLDVSRPKQGNTSDPTPSEQE